MLYFLRTTTVQETPTLQNVLVHSLHTLFNNYLKINTNVQLFFKSQLNDVKKKIQLQSYTF